MNNKKMMHAIDKLINDSHKFWKKLCDIYGPKYGFDRYPFTLYTTNFDKPYTDDMIRDIRYSTDYRMITVLVACGTNNIDIPLADRIVTEIGGGVFMSYEELYSLIIECELDFEKALESMKFALKHEMGHIIDAHVIRIGNNIEEWNKNIEINNEESKKVSKLRKNASYENRLKWYKEYFQIPQEKRANDYVGITEDDIIADWARTH